ncbi:MAG: DUF2383 domain-containing protein [Rhodanobacter sp.]
MPPRVAKSICNDLIRRSIDLRKLYRHAAAACEPGLRMVLGENAQTLDLLIADMQAQVVAAGEKPCRRGSHLGVVKQQAAELLVRIAARRDNAWVHALAHHESSLLHAFEDAISAAPAGSALMLRRQLPRLRNIHLDMHNLSGTARS